MRGIPHNREAIVPRIPQDLPGDAELDALLHSHDQSCKRYLKT